MQAWVISFTPRYLCRSICLCGPASFCCFGVLLLIGSAEAVEAGSSAGVARFRPRPAPPPLVAPVSLSGVATPAGFLGGRPRRGLLGGGCDPAGLTDWLFSVPSLAGAARFLPLACGVSSCQTKRCNKDTTYVNTSITFMVHTSYHQPFSHLLFS